MSLRASLSRTLLTLTSADLAVLEACAQLGGEIKPVDHPKIVEFLHDFLDESECTGFVDTHVQRLRERGLIYGTPARSMLAPDVMNALPTGLVILQDPQALSYEQILSRLEGLATAQLKILQTLQQSGGVGVTKDAAFDANPQRPIPQLLKAGLLERIDEHSVKLPLTVRYGLLQQQPPKLPITLSSLANQPQRELTHSLGQAAIGTALETLRRLRSLLEYLSRSPVELLRNGSLGVRATQQLCTALRVEDHQLYQLLAIGLASRLVALGPLAHANVSEDATVLAATAASEEFVLHTLAEQWAIVAHSWYANATFAPWKVGTLSEASKPLRAFEAETFLEKLIQLRREALAVFASSDAAACSIEELAERFAYFHPLQALTLQRSSLEQICTEAVELGILATDGHLYFPTSLLRNIANEQALLDVVETLTPAEVTKLIPQADFTLLATGPLAAAIHQELACFAIVESSGVAAVYRITEESLRHAYDAGKTPEDIQQFLAAHTLTPLPETMTYFIHDVARTHGQIRSGVAVSYVRCDDPVLLTTVVRSQAAQQAGMRLLAPTVAITQTPLATLLQMLEAEGIYLVAEDENGYSMDVRARARFLPTPKQRVEKDPADFSEHLESVVAHLLQSTAGTTASDATDAALRAQDNVPQATPHQSALQILQAAIRAGKKVSIETIDRAGASTQLQLTPITVHAGQLSAIHEATGQLHQLQIHRISSVTVLD